MDSCFSILLLSKFVSNTYYHISIQSSIYTELITEHEVNRCINITGIFSCIRLAADSVQIFNEKNTMNKITYVIRTNLFLLLPIHLLCSQVQGVKLLCKEKHKNQ